MYNEPESTYPDDRWKEEGQSLHSDVVQKENHRGSKSDRVENAGKQLLPVHLVEHLSSTDTLRLDTSNRQLALFRREPPRRLRTIGEREERNESQAAGDDTFNDEDHPPRRKAANATESENSGCEQTSESTGKRCHDDVEGEAEGKLATSVPTGEVVGDARQHACLEDSWWLLVKADERVAIC